jgi:TRAP-type C4-dicarboxylate transport system substrate-binding protein
LFLVFALVIPPVPAGHAEITLRFAASAFEGMNPQGLLIEQWCKEVAERTNSRVKASYYPGSTLAPATQTYEAVVKGIADVGSSLPAFTKGRFPLTEVIDLPMGYKSGSQGNRLANAFYQKFKPKEFNQTKIMYMMTTGPLFLFTKNQPVNKLEDLKGLKIRGTGNSVRLVQLLGAAAVGMPIGECYDALSRGVVDGLNAPYDTLKAFRFADYIRYSTEHHSTHCSAIFVAMNKQKWESIAPEDQKIIMQINEEWAEKHGKLWDEVDKGGKDLLLQKGGKIIKLSREEDARWTKALSPMLDEYVKSMQAKGLPGDEALKFCLDYLKAN